MKYKFRIKHTSRDLKKQTLDTLKKELTASKSIILFSSQFVTHQDFETLRKNLVPVSASLRFVKNTLFKVAAKEMKLPESLYTDAILLGPTAVVYVNSDDFVGPLKVIKEAFGKNENVKIKVAFLDKEVYESSKVLQFASIPSKNELYAKLVGSLKSSIYGLYNALTYDMRRLVIGLNNISSKTQS